MHGWGEHGFDPTPLVCQWELTVFDNANQPCSIVFDLITDDSFIIIGLGVGKYAIQNCIATPNS